MYSIEIETYSSEAEHPDQNVNIRKSRTLLSPIIEESQIELGNSDSNALYQQETIIQQRNKCLVDIDI